MRAAVLALAGISAACSPSAEVEVLPAFVEQSPYELSLTQSAIDDTYVFNDFRDAGSDKDRIDLAGALVVIDSPKMWVTSLCDAAGGVLVAGKTGWTMKPDPPQCSERETAARARLQTMLDSGATMTIDRTGALVVTSPDGLSARGNVMISTLVD